MEMNTKTIRNELDELVIDCMKANRNLITFMSKHGDDRTLDMMENIHDRNFDTWVKRSSKVNKK